MRLAALALSRRVIAGQPSQLGALDVEEGLVALRARHLEPGIGFGAGVELKVRLTRRAALGKAGYPIASRRNS